MLQEGATKGHIFLILRVSKDYLIINKRENSGFLH